MSFRSAIGSSILLLLVVSGQVSAQIFDESNTIKVDTNYIKVYRDELTTRMYLSRKQNGYSMSGRLLNSGLKYKTNDNLLWGLGATYSFLTLNVAVKLPLINTDDDLYGESRYFDLQTHTMFRSFLVDLYLQWNRGYYVSNPENLYQFWDPDLGYPIRGDLRTSILGLNLQYLLNSSRFSYKASFMQNEFQRKSAGSPIFGIEAYWMLGMADSSLIPVPVPRIETLDQDPFNQADIVNVGLNGGYAYTFVWDEKLYVSVSSVIGLSGGYHYVHNTFDASTCCNGISAGINNLFRISMGFNSNMYYAGLSYIFFSMSNLVGSPGDWITYSTGNIRFNVVRRFKLKKPIKMLRPDLWIF